MTVHGWVRSTRIQKHVAFASISDGSTTSSLQVVGPPDMLKYLTTGAAAEFTGVWNIFIDCKAFLACESQCDVIILITIHTSLASSTGTLTKAIMRDGQRELHVTECKVSWHC